MNDKEEKSGARSIVILAILVVVIGIYSATYGLSTLVWVGVHRWTAANPWLLDVPTSLPPQPASDHLDPLPSSSSPKKQAKPDLLKAYTYEFCIYCITLTFFLVVPSVFQVKFQEFFIG